MPRSLWPPQFVMLPIGLLTGRDAHGCRLPAGALETWLDFRALAWARRQTPLLDFAQLHALTGKSRSTLCAHLARLADWGCLQWRLSDGRVQVCFLDEAPAADGNSAAAEPAPPTPESKTPDAADIPILKDSEATVKTEEIGAVQFSRPAGKRPADPRTARPALQACRALTGRYPDRALYDRLLAVLGEAPDLERLRRCREEWVERGYNPASWKWAVEWYVTGIPERFVKGGRPHETGHTGGGDGPAEAAAQPSALARRLAGKG